MSPADRVCHIIRVFGSPTRLAIILLLAEGPKSRADLMDSLALSKASFGAAISYMRGVRLIDEPVSKSGLYCLTATITVTPEAIQIDAAGLPVTIGRHINRAGG